MRDMNFPLDIVWIRDDLVVGCQKNIAIFDENGRFQVVHSGEPVNFVLELNAGSCDRLHINSETRFDRTVK